MDEVEKKVVQAMKRQNEIALEQLQKAQVHLYPGGSGQERMVGPWYYLFRYGEELIDRLAGSIE
jgi:bacillithiol synthase